MPPFVSSQTAIGGDGMCFRRRSRPEGRSLLSLWSYIKVNDISPFITGYILDILKFDSQCPQGGQMFIDALLFTYDPVGIARKIYPLSINVGLLSESERGIFMR